MLDIYSRKQKRDAEAVSSIALTTEMRKTECQLLSNGIRTCITNLCKMAIDHFVTRENLT